MRVLFCQPSSTKPAISGPERQTVQIARALQARGHEVTIGVILVHLYEDIHSTTLAQHAGQYGIPAVPLYLPEKYNLRRSVRRFRLFYGTGARLTREAELLASLARYPLVQKKELSFV
jgi:hypothetical protein